MARKQKLPAAPDFAAIEAAAPATASQRTHILALLGNLGFTWSNNESILIYMLQALLETDFASAAVVFASLNSARARVDTVRRLAKLKINDAETIKTLEKLLERFDACTKVRNEFNHSIFQLDPRGQITHANILRIKETKTGIEYADIRKVDDKLLKMLEATIKKLTVLNRELWAFLPILERALKKTSGTASA